MRLRIAAASRWARTRLAAEDGFTMLIALGVLTVVLLLVGAAFVAAQGDIHNGQHDLDGKRAYYAARSGVNAFLYKLNQDPELWSKCPTQTTIPVPGTPSGTTLTYAYKPVPANGKPACSAIDPINTMIDAPSGSFSMQFTGTSGTPPVTRTLVASFRRDSTLDYLWYSVYETLDPNTYSNPSSYQDCAAPYPQRPSHCVRIDWITGDVINGPMYTQDQYSVCGAPVFGRSGRADAIETTQASLYANNSCSNNVQMNGKPNAGVGIINPPADNSALLSYAQSEGVVCSGTVTVVLSGTTASLTGSCTAGGTSVSSVNLTQRPIIYATNGTCSATYSPYNVSYTGNTGCGNVYVKGTYSTPVTIGAANDIIINGSLTTSLSGTAVAGLVANNFVRVQHGVTTRSGSPSGYGQCGSASNASGQTLTNPTIDAAILAINHSFIVDNYDCGAQLGNLTVNGSIAQLFRGTVGTSSGGSASTGYLKNYNYDDRLKALEPPRLFDLALASWRIFRETSCTPASGNPSTSC